MSATIAMKLSSRNERAPQFRLGGEIEPGWHHANDRKWLGVYHELLAQDVGVRAKAALPKRITQDNDVVVATGLVVFRKNGSPERGRAAQGGKKVGGDESTGNLRRLRSACDVENPLAVGSDVFHRSRFALEIEKGRVGQVSAGIGGMSFLDAQQAVAVRVGERPQEDAVHHEDDSGCRAHAECQRQHGDGGEAGRLTQDAKCETKVLKQRFEEGKAAAFAINFFGLFEAAKVEERFATGLLRTHALAEIALDGHFQVGAQLGIELAIEAAAVEEGPQTMEQLAKPGDHF